DGHVAVALQFDALSVHGARSPPVDPPARLPTPPVYPLGSTTLPSERRVTRAALLVCDLYTVADANTLGAVPNSPIIYTLTDEAPLLATYSFLPIIQAYANAAGVPVESRDISVAARILAT